MILPESVVESKPRETVVIFVGRDEVVVQGQAVVRVDDILNAPEGDIVPIMDRLATLEQSVIGPNTLFAAGSQEITILADKSVPFDVVRRVMSSCTSQGYGRISLAVMQKGGPMASTAQVAQS
jgi:biopolymer transport protein ExbD